VIHVATAHFGTERWIDVQLSYLSRNITEPFHVWTSLQDVPGEHTHKFHRVVPSAGPHAGKLNLLAAEIAVDAARDDIVIFLDGDAFPVRDPMPTVRHGLENSVLVAIRRDENATDHQPHPSFCAVRVGDWQDLPGDWSPGHSWIGPGGAPTTDVGGNLLRILEITGKKWTPMLRSNRVNPHPLWFGVYDDVVYHHGAGFRWAIGRVDLKDGPAIGSLGRRLPVAGKLLRRLDASRTHRWKQETRAESERLGEEWFSRLSRDPEFYKALL